MRALFDDMAHTYGRINVITSFGFTARWRHAVVKGLPLHSTSHVVDLMSGMGELCRSLATGLPASARVTAVDISPEMSRRASRDWPFTVCIVTEDVLEWAPPEGCADLVTSSFGIKTLDERQQASLALLVARLLQPGGRFSFIEVSVPRFLPLRWLYLLYLKWLIPPIGRLFLGNPQSYRMLGIYTEAFGDCRHFAACLERAGLEVAFERHFFGCATGVRGRRP